MAVYNYKNMQDNKLTTIINKKVVKGVTVAVAYNTLPGTQPHIIEEYQKPDDEEGQCILVKEG